MNQLDLRPASSITVSEGPKAYRLAIRKEELILQGAFYRSWTTKDGMPCGQLEWMDIPTVILSEDL